MAHFARVIDGQVVRVHVVANDVLDDNGVENQRFGQEFLANLHGGNPDEFVQASYNGNIRKNYPGVGFAYDVTLDGFIPPKPYDSWVLNEDTCQWEAPIACPGGAYIWDEDSGSWAKPAKPFKSWTWDDNVMDWVAPVPYPTDGAVYSWDEEAGDWVGVVGAS